MRAIYLDFACGQGTGQWNKSREQADARNKRKRETRAGGGLSHISPEFTSQLQPQAKSRQTSAQRLGSSKRPERQSSSRKRKRIESGAASAANSSRGRTGPVGF